MSPNFIRLGLNAIRFVSVVLTLSLVIFVHERGLIPLYGSGPTSFLLDKIVFAAVIASAIHPVPVSLTRNLLYTAVALSIAPNATHWIGVWTSRRKDPLLGPAITHATALAPLVFLLTTFVAEMEDSDLRGGRPIPAAGRPPLVLRLVRGGITYLISNLLSKRIWSPKPIFYDISDSQILMDFFLSFTKPPPKPSKKNNSQQKAAKDPRLANPILPHPLRETYTHPTYPLQILSAEQSVTGLITVGQWLPPPDYTGGNDQQLHSARYLRASHSILGGVWTHDKVGVLDDEPPITDSFGNLLGDSIYSTFVLQEAVRLINSTEIGKAGAWKNALVIGLGTGISATSFMRHGIPTTIVEIDPAVYNAARTFFGLPDPGSEKVFLEDARAWTAKQRAAVEAGNKRTLFDIVVHDCFSGGGVPQHIFTMEFWDDLKAVMEPEGVLVVNFAGVLRSQSSQLVVNTLEKSFRQCRAFHDMFSTLLEEKYDTEFINIVLFCTQSSSPLTFRKTLRSDWLGSPLRRHVLKTLDSREVNLDLIRDASGDDRHILTDQNNPLGALQERQGAHHWLVMREVLPDTHWETY
ncbi:spermidine synthase [Flammula alnicola]|nr:spermidine synthase [Flammula alnicola]